MASKQSAPRGMQNFVMANSNAATEDSKPNANPPIYTEDLRVSHARKGQSANTRQPRTQDHGVLQQHAQNAQNAQKGPPPLSHRDGKGHFYDTDTASIGGTSETPSLQPPHSHTHAVQDAEMDHSVNASQPQPSSDGGRSDEQFEGDDSDDEGDDSADEADVSQQRFVTIDGQRFNAKGLQEFEAIAAHLASQRPGQSLPHLKGDSYPSTTSGPHSPVDPTVEQIGSLRQAPQEPRYTRQHLPSRGLGQHQPLATRQLPESGKSQVARQPPSYQVPPNAVPIYLPQAPSHEKANAGNRMSTKMSADVQREAEPTGYAPKATVSSNAAQRGSEPKLERSNRHTASDQRDKLAAKPSQRQTNLENGLIQNQAPPTKPWKAPQLGAKPKRLASPKQDHEDVYDEVLQREPDAEEEKAPSPDPLDYDGPHLFGMSFSELKSQSFDTDPRAEAVDLPNISSDDFIEQRMTNSAAFRVEEQAAFLQSLPIGEWEEAGDWFLTKFGETLDKLKLLRQEKRRAARAFEEEVEGRHGMVVKKRKVTEDALAQMKQSGGQVLQGTPKKTKTK